MMWLQGQNSCHKGSLRRSDSKIRVLWFKIFDVELSNPCMIFSKILLFLQPLLPCGCFQCKIRAGEKSRVEISNFPLYSKRQKLSLNAWRGFAPMYFQSPQRDVQFWCHSMFLLVIFTLKGWRGGEKESLLLCLALFSCSFSTILLLTGAILKHSSEIPVSQREFSKESITGKFHESSNGLVFFHQCYSKTKEFSWQTLEASR